MTNYNLLRQSSPYSKRPLRRSVTPHPHVRLRYIGGSTRHAPHRYKHNQGEDFINYPITDAQGVTRQVTFIQVVMGPDPLVLGLMDDSEKVYSRPLYAEPKVLEKGKPHYAPEDMYAFVGGHSNQHCVDRAVNELKDTSLKAELTRYRAYKREAERMEQRLHTLAQALGGVQGEITRSKFRLEMADSWDRITEVQEGWMGGIGPTRRRGHRS
ncbi:hypothetical protein EDB85DRAFT_2153517 [Lactarius pseudohatsudake]|nr:hypothetical protein EDB85DRAFT_2153517 [Lactarius pseudohatsudake]